MPTFTAIALESLLQPRNDHHSNTSSSIPFKQNNHHHHHNNTPNNINTITTTKPQQQEQQQEKKKHIYISSPALYATPQPAPIPYSSAAISVSPSPYVLNHKRRRHLNPTPTPLPLPEPEAPNSLHGFEIKQQQENNNNNNNNPVVPVAPFLASSSDNTNLHFDILLNEGGGEEDDEENEKLVQGDLVEEPKKKKTDQTEFFDADEEFFSDHGSLSNASPSRFTNIEEVHAARVNLFDEIEKRKRAEDALAEMRSRWQRIKTHLSQVGLSSFPAMGGDDGEDNAQLEIDMVEQFCQEVVVTRFVSEAIGRGLARAETEAAAEAVMESKNLEISRLRDKLSYYETVNREMFQRNQEVVEIARNQRDRRKNKQRWIWRCIGLSFTLGASLLAYSYLPEMSRDSPAVNTADMSDVPSSTLDSS